MFIRLIAFVTCQVTLIACVLAAYDVPGWTQMPAELKAIIAVSGGVALLLLLFLSLVPEERISHFSEDRQIKARRQGIGQSLR